MSWNRAQIKMKMRYLPASKIGVLPSLSLMLTSAPFASSSLTISSCPLFAAKNKKEKQTQIRGNASFFLVALSHINLESMFKYNFALIQHHKWSYHDLEHMIPWERDIYLELLHQWIKEEEERQREQQRKQRG